MDTDKTTAMNKAIDRIKGQEVAPGTIVASRDNDLTWKFIRYDGDFAVCTIDEKSERQFPRAEIFDVKKVINAANHFLNLGFWEEGMQGMFVTLK